MQNKNPNPLHYEKQVSGDILVLGYETVFGEYVKVARIERHLDEIRAIHHYHGYYPKHRYGKLVVAYCKRRGYNPN